MKFLFLFLVVCVAAGSCTVINGQDLPQKPATKEFLFRQKNLLRLLNHVTMPNVHQDQVELGRAFNIKANLDKFTNVEAIREFLAFYRIGMLPKYKIFSITNRRLRDEAVTLFHLFFYAKDFETFYRSACWAREHVNEGMFVYALHVAVLHRQDTRGFILPPPYEIYPFYFLNNEVIQKAQRVKMQGRVFDSKLGDFYGIQQVGNTFLINSNYSGWYTQMNDETKLTYFTEDVGLNSYYFYFHLDYPFWMHGEKYGLNKDRRGEIYYFFYQQLLARFYMERLSNNLGEIPKFSWRWPIRVGFLSNIRHSNGLTCPSRNNFFDIQTERNVWRLQDVTDCERRIRDAIRSGFVLNEQGGFVSIKNPEGINILGNIVQGNGDSPNQRFYRYCTVLAKKLLGNGQKTVNNAHFVNPGVIQQYETALRDPMFYQLYRRFMHYFFRYKETLQPYTVEELSFPGVKVEDVHVDKLVTFFDFFDVDITNAVYRNEEEMKADKDKFLIVAHQYRLNHKPFDVRIDVTSDKTTDVVVRIFLGPKYDSKGFLLNINDNRYNFVEIDKFLHKLQVGKTTIVRNSREFVRTRKDRTPTRDLLKRIDDSIRGNQDFMLDMSEGHNLIPDRLILPRGKKAGMVFQFFVVVSPFHTPKNALGKGYDLTYSAGVGTGARFLDNRALGYPLDRFVDEYNFFTKNMFMKDVIIFHKSLKDLNRSFLTDNDRAGTDNTFVSDKNFMYDKTFMDDKNFMDNKNFMGNKEFYENRNIDSRERTSGENVMGNYGGFYDRNTEFMDRNTGFLNVHGTTNI